MAIPTEFWLYHLAKDPGETTNIARDHPEKLEEMKRQLEELVSPN